MMMTEEAISLLVAVLVVSRAVNILRLRSTGRVAPAGLGPGTR